MTKKTLYLNCIKNNCDPRKYGKGTIDNNREPNYIKRKRYHRYGLTRKGGNYFDNFIRSLNKMNDGGIRQPWTRLGRILIRWLERLTGYFYSGNSWPQRVLGNSLANELGTYISSIIEIVNTDAFDIGTMATIVYTCYKIIKWGKKSIEAKKLLDKVNEGASVEEKELLNDIEANVNSKEDAKYMLEKVQVDSNEPTEATSVKRTITEEETTRDVPAAPKKHRKLDMNDKLSLVDFNGDIKKLGIKHRKVRDKRIEKERKENARKKFNEKQTDFLDRVRAIEKAKEDDAAMAEEKKMLEDFNSDMKKKVVEHKEERFQENVKKVFDKMSQDFSDREAAKEEREAKKKEKQQLKEKENEKINSEEPITEKNVTQAWNQIQSEWKREAKNSTGEPAFPQSDTTRLDEQTNHVEDTNNTTTETNRPWYYRSLFVNQNSTTTDTETDDTDNFPVYDPSSSFLDYFYDTGSGAGLNEKYGGGLIKTGNSGYNSYMSGIKRAQHAPPVSSTGEYADINNAIEHGYISSNSNNYARSFVDNNANKPPQENKYIDQDFFLSTMKEFKKSIIETVVKQLSDNNKRSSDYQDAMLAYNVANRVVEQIDPKLKQNKEEIVEEIKDQIIDQGEVLKDELTSTTATTTATTTVNNIYYINQDPFMNNVESNQVVTQQEEQTEQNVEQNNTTKTDSPVSAANGVRNVYNLITNNQNNTQSNITETENVRQLYNVTQNVTEVVNAVENSSNNSTNVVENSSNNSTNVVENSTNNSTKNPITMFFLKIKDRISKLGLSEVFKELGIDEKSSVESPLVQTYFWDNIKNDPIGYGSFSVTVVGLMSVLIYSEFIPNQMTEVEFREEFPMVMEMIYDLDKKVPQEKGFDNFMGNTLNENIFLIDDNQYRGDHFMNSMKRNILDSVLEFFNVMKGQLAGNKQNIIDELAKLTHNTYIASNFEEFLPMLNMYKQYKKWVTIPLDSKQHKYGYYGMHNINPLNYRDFSFNLEKDNVNIPWDIEMGLSSIPIPDTPFDDDPPKPIDAIGYSMGKLLKSITNFHDSDYKITKNEIHPKPIDAIGYSMDELLKSIKNLYDSDYKITDTIRERISDTIGEKTEYIREKMDPNIKALSSSLYRNHPYVDRYLNELEGRFMVLFEVSDVIEILKLQMLIELKQNSYKIESNNGLIKSEGIRTKRLIQAGWFVTLLFQSVFVNTYIQELGQVYKKLKKNAYRDISYIKSFFNKKESTITTEVQDSTNTTEVQESTNTTEVQDSTNTTEDIDKNADSNLIQKYSEYSPSVFVQYNELILQEPSNIVATLGRLSSREIFQIFSQDDFSLAYKDINEYYIRNFIISNALNIIRRRGELTMENIPYLNLQNIFPNRHELAYFVYGIKEFNPTMAPINIAYSIEYIYAMNIFLQKNRPTVNLFSLLVNNLPKNDNTVNFIQTVSTILINHGLPPISESHYSIDKQLIVYDEVYQIVNENVKEFVEIITKEINTEEVTKEDIFSLLKRLPDKINNYEHRVQGKFSEYDNYNKKGDKANADKKFDKLQELESSAIGLLFLETSTFMHSYYNQISEIFSEYNWGVEMDESAFKKEIGDGRSIYEKDWRLYYLITQQNEWIVTSTFEDKIFLVDVAFLPHKSLKPEDDDNIVKNVVSMFNVYGFKIFFDFELLQKTFPQYINSVDDFDEFKSYFLFLYFQLRPSVDSFIQTHFAQFVITHNVNIIYIYRILLKALYFERTEQALSMQSRFARSWYHFYE